LIILGKQLKSAAVYRATNSALRAININVISIISFSVLITLAFSYLAFSNFISHSDATVAYLGLSLSRNLSLWPILDDDYSYRGMVYGPGLAEVQMLPISLHLPLILGSKIPGVVAFVIYSVILLRSLEGPAAKGYLIFLIPFGNILFWGRPDPLLLLAVALCILVRNKISNEFLLYCATGLLAAFASSMKIHGAIYIICALIALEVPLFTKYIFVFGLSFAAGFLLSYKFNLEQIMAFAGYLQLIVPKEGLSSRLVLYNLIYLMVLFIPIFLTTYKRKTSQEDFIVIAKVFALELIVAIVGGKPGAGQYYLLPMIPINALILSRLSMKQGGMLDDLKILYISLIIPSLLVSVFYVVRPMMFRWKDEASARNEIINISNMFPDAVMGLSDSIEFPLVYFRVLLKNPIQIDYTAYMDLQVAGVSDNNLIAAMEKCSIEHIVLPKRGYPFSMESVYTEKPLFSDALRAEFSERFEMLHQGDFYSVYQCHST
jgi:hypothetical protein